MFCIKCGARLADGAAFCHSCGADVSGSVADGPSAPAGRRPAFWLVMAAVVLAAGGVGVIGGLLLGRSDDGTGTGVAALPSTSTTAAEASSTPRVAVVEATATISVNGPEDAARRAVQAQIEGDEAAYLEAVRPDDRDVATRISFGGLGDLQGCDLQSAEVLAEEESASKAVVTVVFGRSCAADECRIVVVKLSGHWYIQLGGTGCG